MKGFLPQIPYEFQCLASLRWSGTPPVCHPVTCGGLPTVMNADYTIDKNTYRSIVTYTCAEGYRYVSPSRLLFDPSIELNFSQVIFCKSLLRCMFSSVSV